MTHDLSPRTIELRMSRTLYNGRLLLWTVDGQRPAQALIIGGPWRTRSAACINLLVTL